MGENKIVIKTSLSEKDYRKILYLSTFKEKKRNILVLLLLSFVGGVILGLDKYKFSLSRFILGWLIFSLLLLGQLIYRIKKISLERVETDSSGIFNNINTFVFYDDKLFMGEETSERESEINYGDIEKLVESKEFFIFYIAGNQGIFLRKGDIEDIEGFREIIVSKFKNNYSRL